jgi:hypothetical protein
MAGAHSAVGAIAPRRCDTTAASTDSAISSGVVAGIG